MAQTVRIRREKSPGIGRKAGQEVAEHAKRAPAQTTDHRDLRNYNCEALLISAVVTTGDMYIPDDRGISPEHFESYAATWEWLAKYVEDHEATPSVAALLGAFPRFKYVQTNEVGYATDQVLRSWQSKEMATVIRQAAEHLREREQEAAVDLVLTEATRLRDAVAPVGQASSSISDSAQTYDYVTQVFDTVARTGAAGINTGLPTLDARTGGLRPGQLWVPAARLGNGKSWVMARMAAQAVMDGKTVHFWSLEMQRFEIEIRLHVLLAHLLDGNSDGITALGLEHGTGSLLSYRKTLKRIEREVPGDFFCRALGRDRVAPRNINAALARDPADVVFVDYLQLLDSDETFRESDWRSVAAVSRSLKQVAMANSIPIVAASQINREGAGTRPPRAEHLSQSDGIGQDADGVLTMKIQSPSVIEFFMAKLRGGRGLFGFWAHYNPNEGEIEEVTRDRAEELKDEDQDREDDEDDY